jgi:hypothetical protein
VFVELDESNCSYQLDITSHHHDEEYVVLKLSSPVSSTSISFTPSEVRRLIKNLKYCLVEIEEE